MARSPFFARIRGDVRRIVAGEPAGRITDVVARCIAGAAAAEAVGARADPR